jgi:twinkle protein
MLTERHVKQLKERGLDPGLAAQFGWTSSDRLGDSISIPYVRHGETVNHKYRTLGKEKRFSQDPDATKCLWNFDVLADESLKADWIVITEGELDALSAIQAEFPRTVSVPDGAPAEPLGGAAGPKYAYLDEAMEHLRQATIILAVDGDKAGANLFHDLILRLGRARCKFVSYPFKRSDGRLRCKDLNEVLQEWGTEGVVETIVKAQWAEMDGVYRMSELPPLPENPVMELGFGKPVDDLAKARRGDFWVITGAPGHGKTVFVTDAICRLADRHALRVAWASFENLPQQDLRRQLRKWHIAKQRIERRAEQGAPWNRSEVAAADAWIEQHFRFLVPKDDEEVTVEWLLECATAAVVRQHCDVVIVDPWNELDHNPGGLSLTEYVGGAIKAMKRTARRLQVLWIVIAHPAKVKQGDPINLYSISDSAHWFNKPDLGLVVMRPADDGDAELRVAKARYEEIGRRGSVKIRFNPETRRFNVPVE